MDTLILANAMLFLSTLSLRRATRADSLAHAPPQISIHALLAESDKSSIEEVSKYVVISIHALLAESDAPPAPQSKSSNKISIHALLAESDEATF